MKKNKIKFIGFWLAAVLLAGFYLVMLIIGKNPDVGIEYRMYYITHELSDWPGYGNLSYAFGTVEYCTELKSRKGNDFTAGKVCQRKGQGFHADQYEGSQSIDRESYVYYIPEESSDSAEYVFRINGFTGDGSVVVYANEQEIGSFDSEGDYSLKIGSVAKDKLLTIKFVTDNCSFRLWTTAINR